MLIALFAAAPAWTQTAGGQVVSANAPETGAQTDPERDAALARFVHAMNFYPMFKRKMEMLYSDGNEHDPALERITSEVFPETWVNQILVDFYRPVLAKVSNKDLESGTKFLLTSAGKKFAAQAVHEAEGGQWPAPTWTPAEREAVLRFNLSPAGMALSQAGAGTVGINSEKLGEQMGKERVAALMTAAQAKFAAMNDADFEVEADKLRNGAADASVVEQLAVIKEYTERSMRRMAGVFSGIEPLMRHTSNIQPKEMVTKEDLASLRKDLQAIDDAYVRANEGLQMGAQFLQDVVPLLTLPVGLKRTMQGIVDKLKNPAEDMVRLVAAVQETTAATRALLDFTESHTSTITLGNNGKLNFANQADLDTFLSLAGNVDGARNRLREMGQSTKKK
jgi:hypothetical protein